MIQELFAKPLYIQLNFGILVGSALLVALMALVPCFRRCVYGEGNTVSMWKLPDVPIFRGSNFPLTADYILMLFYVASTTLLIGTTCLGLDSPPVTSESTDNQADLINIWINVCCNFIIYLPLIIRYAIASGFRFDIKFSHLAATILALFCIYAASITVSISGLVKWITENTGSPETQHAIQQITQETAAPLTILPIIVSAVIVAPIVEEIFFRGFVFNILKKHAGILPAALACGLFFGAVHISLVQCIILTVFGIVQCFLYEHTRSILYPILLHMLFNGISMTALILFRQAQ